MPGLTGTIADAFYGAPTPNPAYGAVQVSPEDYINHLKAAGITLPDNYTPPTEPKWISPTGHDVTYGVNSLGMDPNQKFSDQPGFASRLFSPKARNVMEQNEVSETFPGMQSQALQAQLAASRGQAATDVQNTIGKVNTLASQPNQRNFASFGVSNPVQAGIYDTTTANLAAGVPQAQAQEALATANAGAASHPAEANTDIAASVYDLIHNVTPAELARRKIEAQTIGIGGPTRGALMIGGTAGSPTLNKIQNPLLGGQLGMYSSMAGGLGGLGGPSTVTSPSGNMYPAPAAASSITVPPVSYDLTGKKGIESTDPREMAANEALQNKLDNHDDNHEAAQATIASQIAALKARQKQLQAYHSNNRMSILGHTTGGTLYDIGTLGEPGRNFTQGVYNLLGRAHNYLTENPYNK
jgi:hypothetical protein